MQCIDFSQRKVTSTKLCFLPYGIELKMKIWLFSAFLIAFCSSFVLSEYSGRRHQILSQNQQDERQRTNEQLDRYIEEWARLKFQQQMQHKHQQHHQKPPPPSSYPQEITGPGFSFVLPMPNRDIQQHNIDEPVEFAVQPFDSRFYETSDIDDAGYEIDENSNPVRNNVKNIQNYNNMNDIDIPSDSKSLIPPPMHVLENNKQIDRILHRNQKQKGSQTQQDVMQKPLQVEFDNTMSLYIVALIAGLSCAFSTGLIALGLMYWTLYKKSKSADACDYACDYGVIGPRSKNLENSQAAMGDKKLAHSAQMFHYQHQKQQIIAMENRNAEMNHNNDDENDSDDNENDFTVYECPGLAEWDSGMEVKNPLFTEETPATKNEKAQANKAASK